MTSNVNGTKEGVDQERMNTPIKEAMEVWNRLWGVWELAVKIIIIQLVVKPSCNLCCVRGGSK